MIISSREKLENLLNAASKISVYLHFWMQMISQITVLPSQHYSTLFMESPSPNKDDRCSVSSRKTWQHKNQGAPRHQGASLPQVALFPPTSVDSLPAATLTEKFYCAILNRRLTGCGRVSLPLVVLYRRDEYF